MKQTTHLYKSMKKYAATKLLRTFLLCGAVSIFFASCNNRPERVLDRERMTALLIDVHKAEGLLDVVHSEYNTDSAQKAVMASVLLKHGISKADYDSSLIWYSQHLDELIKVYDRVNKNLVAENKEWAALIHLTKALPPTAAGDTVNIWQQKTYAILDRERLSSLFVWEVPADSNFCKGDSIYWSFDMLRLPQGHYAVATLSLRIRQDSLVSTTSVIDSAGSYGLAASVDSLTDLQLVVGSINLLPRQDTVKSLPAFIDDVKVMRYHRK